MQNHYEINVSLNGKHFFATTPRSARDFLDAQKIYKALCDKFPTNEGYEVNCTHWQAAGRSILGSTMRGNDNV